MKIVKIQNSLNTFWKNTQNFSIAQIFSMFKVHEHREGLLGIVISRQNDNLKNCVTFYGMWRKQRRSRIAVAMQKSTYVPTLVHEYLVVVRRYDDGIPRHTQYILCS